MSLTLEEAMYLFYDGIEILGPGSENTTRKLLEIVPDSTTKMSAVDIGCGTGRSSIVLAKNDVNVVSVDDHQSFLDTLNEKANSLGLDTKIRTKNMSMDEMDLPEKSFDILWSEASAYVIGFRKALKDWRKYLKPNGYTVVTECCWTTETPSKELVDFWAEEYPGMISVEEARIIAEELGYEIVSEFNLPESDWDSYYNPLKKRIQQLKEDAEPEIQQVIQHTSREIEIRDKYKSDFGYVAFILQLPC